MVIVINSWRLDTCSCILHYYWDNEVPQEQITTTFFAVENTCPAHDVLIGLDKGEPDWERLTHDVATENAARFAIVGDAIDRNEINNLAVAKDDLERITIQRRLTTHKEAVVDRYSKIFDTANVKAISKGIWNSVDEENKRKNRAIDEIVQRAPDIYVDISPTDGTRTLKPHITIDFAWTGQPPNRIIKMIVKGVTLPQNHFDALQTRLNNRFGVGKVLLENPA